METVIVLGVVALLAAAASAVWLRIAFQSSRAQGWWTLRAVGVICALISGAGALAGFADDHPLGGVGLVILVASLFLTAFANERVRPRAGDSAHGPASASQNLVDAYDLGRSKDLQRERQEFRQKFIDEQLRNDTLERAVNALRAENTALKERIRRMEFEASLPPDPFADAPITPHPR